MTEKYGTKLYWIWHAMKKRCESPIHKQYSNYGARGISVYDEWHDYKTFYKWADSHGYIEGLSIDRIDVNGNYEPDNCRWIPLNQQNYNKRNSRLVSINGCTKTVAEWSKESGVYSGAILKRLNSGWDSGKAVFEPSQVKHKSNTPAYNRKRVICMSNLKVYESATEAAKSIGVNNSCIIRACKGKQKTVKGVVFKYA